VLTFSAVRVKFNSSARVQKICNCRTSIDFLSVFSPSQMQMEYILTIYWTDAPAGVTLTA
jgi:hypothetical protein